MRLVNVDRLSTQNQNPYWKLIKTGLRRRHSLVGQFFREHFLNKELWRNLGFKIKTYIAKLKCMENLRNISKNASTRMKKRPLWSFEMRVISWDDETFFRLFANITQLCNGTSPSNAKHRQVQNCPFVCKGCNDSHGKKSMNDRMRPLALLWECCAMQFVANGNGIVNCCWRRERKIRCKFSITYSRIEKKNFSLGCCSHQLCSMRLQSVSFSHLARLPYKLISIEARSQFSIWTN